MHESVEQRLAIKRDVDDDHFKETVSHHAHEEDEGKRLPKLWKLPDREERAALGDEVRPNQTAEAPPHV